MYEIGNMNNTSSILEDIVTIAIGFPYKYNNDRMDLKVIKILLNFKLNLINHIMSTSHKI